MLDRLIGNGSSVSELKAGLTHSTENVRQIAHRVANAASGEAADFASVLEDAQGGRRVDLEKEMVSLAEEQIRFEATSQLLQKVYQQIRTSIRER
jgi:flagellar basal body rod protein FlgB